MVFTSQGTVLVLKTQGHVTKMDKVSGSEASFLLGIEVGDMQLTRNKQVHFSDKNLKEGETGMGWGGFGEQSQGCLLRYLNRDLNDEKEPSE